MNVTNSRRGSPLALLTVVVIYTVSGPINLLGQGNAAAKQADTGIGVVWQKRDTSGAELGVVSNIRGPVTRKVGTKARKDAAGKTVETKEVFGQSPQAFTGDNTYYSRLDPSIRGKVTFIEIKIRPALVQNVDDGTILNVDGAVIGFSQVANNAGPAAIEILIRDLGKDGKAVWVKTGLVYAINAKDNTPAPSRFFIKLDHKNKVWSLLFNNVLVDDFIALGNSEPSPTFSICAGAGKTARLERLEVLEGAPHGNGRFTNDASMDLAQAYRTGAKDIAKSGEKIVHPPRK